MNPNRNSDARYPSVVGPDDFTLHASGAETASGNSVDMVNDCGRNAVVTIDITALAGTSPTLTVTLQGCDPASGKYRTILASTALNAVGTTYLKVSPHLTAAANSVAQDLMPGRYRVQWTLGGTSPNITFSIGVSIIP